MESTEMTPMRPAIFLILSAAAFAVVAVPPAMAIDVNVQVNGAEVVHFTGPDVPVPSLPPMETPPPVNCIIPSLPICISASPCANTSEHISIFVDQRFLIWVSVGMGGPGAYAGFSEACNTPH
ncbi:MAG: hypothetical protein ABR586_05590 [Thermoplasmatota archaeon]